MMLLELLDHFKRCKFQTRDLRALQFLLLLIAGSVHADPIKTQLPAQSGITGGYIVPNEEYPLRALRAYQAVPSGAYLTVGTERGYIAAASSPNVTHLLLMDIDPGIVNYNRVNTLLLKIAPDRNAYINLRTKPLLNDWQSLAQKNLLSPSEQKVLADNFDSWKRNVAESGAFDNFHSKPFRKFRKVNYLHDDALFARIQKLARDDKIVAGVLDLQDKASVLALKNELIEKQIKVAALDISNVWWDMKLQHPELYARDSSISFHRPVVTNYVDRVQFSEALDGLVTEMEDKALVITTHRSGLTGQYQMIKDLTQTPWNYEAHRVGTIRKKYSDMKHFFNALDNVGMLRMGGNIRIDRENALRCSIREFLSGVFSH